jgi:predicted ABC-type transport system involved in lysophospholipase L1 biosynthesis ATPase subunit
LRNITAIRASGRRVCDRGSSTIISLRKGTHRGPFGMDKKRAHYPHRLYGGQPQRVLGAGHAGLA